MAKPSGKPRARRRPDKAFHEILLEISNSNPLLLKQMVDRVDGRPSDPRADRRDEDPIDFASEIDKARRRAQLSSEDSDPAE